MHRRLMKSFIGLVVVAAFLGACESTPPTSETTETTAPATAPTHLGMAMTTVS